jgi:hypothetical protein
MIFFQNKNKNKTELSLLFILDFFTCGRPDIQHNDIQHNDIQHNDIQRNDIQHKDIQHNDIQHNDIQQNDIQHNEDKKVTMSISLMTLDVYTECHHPERHFF